MRTTTEQSGEAFEADPENVEAFEALEEQRFLHGDWDSLVALYRHRLTAPSLGEPATRLPLLFRLGQVLEERSCDVDAAIETYTEIARLQPGYWPALRQLRGIYVRREQWEMVLQIAEIEGQTPMPPHEQAAFFAELGEIWRRELLDMGEAMKALQRALATDPQHCDALRSLALTHEALGEAREASGYWEQLAGRLRDIERAPILVALGRLAAGPLGEPDRAEVSYREAMDADPRCIEAVDALLIITCAREQWADLEDLYERRFDLTSGARSRSAIALEAARLHHERLDNARGAASWVQRALDLAPDDPSAHHARAEIARAAGNLAELGEALERVIEFAGSGTPASVLLEAAELHSAEGREQKAVGYLERALERTPGDSLVLEALSDSLSRTGRHHRHAEVLELRAELAHDDPETQVEVLGELGRVLAESLDDPGSAIEAYQQALALQPEAPGIASQLERCLRKREDWDALRAHLERQSELGTAAQQCSAFCGLADLHCGPLEDHVAAARCFEQALALQADCEPALRGLEALARANGDEDAIVRICEREARITSDLGRLTELVDELATLLEGADRVEDALGWLEHLIEAVPDHREALERAAGLQDRLGRTEALVATLEQLDPLLPTSEQPENRRRRAALHRAAGRFDEALACWRSTLALEPGDVTSLRALEQCYAEMRDWPALAETRRALVEHLPDAEQASCLDALAQLLELQLADPEAALDVLARLAERNDAPPTVNARRSALLERTGRFAELVDVLALQRDALPQDSDLRWPLDLERGRLLMDRVHDFVAGAQACRAVLQANPDCDEALERLERAVRLIGDPEPLADLLGELAEREDDAARRAAHGLERAELLEDVLDRSDEATVIYTHLCSSSETPEPIAARAGERLENLLERRGDFAALVARREERLATTTDEASKRALHENLAGIYGERLEDWRRSADHLECAVALDETRVDLWCRLEALYERHECDAERLRAVEAQLECNPSSNRELELHMVGARLCLALGQRDSEAAEHYECALELDPANAEALETLVAHYDRAGRPRDVVRLLEMQLDALQPEDETERCLGLRLRIAQLRRDALDDIDGAVAALEPALALVGAIAALAEPLAQLYEQGAYDDDLARLCQQAAEATEDEEEEACWQMRLGTVLRALGRSEQAAEAYAAVLTLRPDHAEAREPLCALYRELGAHEQLVPELELTLAAGRGPALPLHLELAALLEDRLDRPTEALDHLERALELAPERRELAEQAMTLAEALGRDETLRALIEDQLARVSSPEQRAQLLGRRARLLAGALGRPEDAVIDVREALTLAPSPALREALQEALTQLGQTEALLDCLNARAEAQDEGDRVRWLEQGVAVSEQSGEDETARLWLERLRAERCDDPSIPARLGEIHRRAGRSQARLRCLEDESTLLGMDDEARAMEIALECAGLLEDELDAPSRAARTLASARQRFPDEPRILATLDRLYASLGRPHERAAVLEDRLRTLDEGADPATRADFHREAAALYREPLAQPEAAVAHLLRAIALVASPGHDEPGCADLLTSLLDVLHAAGYRDAWCRAAEAWLSEAVDEGETRRAEIRLELGQALAALGRNEAALAHYDALLDGAVAEESRAPWLDAAELGRIALLRATGREIELGRSLRQRLERCGGDAAEWLELARLDEERLHRLDAAARAYTEVLAQEPESLQALRGARRCAARLGRHEDVAAALEAELPLLDGAEARASVRRALAVILRDQLGRAEDAAQSLRGALEEAPDDLPTLQSLAALCEQTGEYGEALAVLEREVELLAEREPQRRRELWLRVAELASERTDEPERADRAFDNADEIEPLEAAVLRDWAELQQSQGLEDRFCEIFERYCDAPDACARATDHLRLAQAQELLGDRDAARRRVERALEIDPDDADGWDAAAQLTDDPLERADALERAAALLEPEPARERLIKAARGTEADHPERASALLATAIERSPTSATAHALRARVEASLGRDEETREAADRALELDADSRELDDAETLECARVGGRSASATGNPDAAARFFARALEIAPEDIESLEGSVDALFALGELAAAREVIEKRLARDGEDDAARARQLAMLGTAHEAERDLERALACFDDALELDPEQPLAHAGRCRVLEGDGRMDDAVEAWQQWSEAEPGRVEKARHRVHAAEIELGRDRQEAACSHLEAALDADAACATAAVLLAETRFDLDDADAAFGAAEAGRDATPDDDQRCRLELVRARVLEARGERDEAECAYAAALEARPACAEAGEARAALLRSQGDWSAACDVLGAVLEAGAESMDPGERTHLLCERGRLLAGPLEQVESAIDCFESALALDGQLASAREQLANLQSHLPEHFARAVAHHEVLLDADPTQRGGLRALLRIAHNTPSARSARSHGLALLRALGVATLEEREGAPRHLDLHLEFAGGTNPLFETLRSAARQADEALEQALGEAATPANTPYLRALAEAEGELAGRALCGASEDTLRDCFEALVALSQDYAEAPTLAGTIEAHLSRRTRRKLRRRLEGVSREALEQLDFGEWQQELREMAAGAALNECQGDLRTALLDLCSLDDAAAGDVSETTDLSTRVGGSQAARSLLRQVVLNWCAELRRAL